MATRRTASGLLRVLGTAFALAVALGNMVGSGIFRSPGVIVGLTGSVALAALLIVLVGVQSLLSANLLAEVSSSVAQSGGSVVFIRRAFGDTAAAIIGWTDAMACVAGMAQVSVAATGFLGIVLSGAAPYPGLIAAALIIGFSAINWRGVVVGEVTQLLASAAQGLLMIGLIILLFWLSPLPPPAVSAAIPVAPVAIAGGLLVAYQLAYGTFAGWAFSAYFAEETRDIGRTLPRALAGSIIAFGALYLAMLFALGHVLPTTLLAGANFPAHIALGQALGPVGIMMLSLVACVALLTSTNAGVMPNTRVFFALGEAGYAPAILKRVNTGGTPDVALWVATALAVLLVLTGRYETIFILMGTLSLAVTTALDLAFFQLRRREPDLERPFRAIGYPVLPALALALDFTVLALIAASDLWSTAYALILVAIGIVAMRIAAMQRVQHGMPI